MDQGDAGARAHGTDPEEAAERGRMGRISGGLWMLGGLVGVAGLALPGSEHVAPVYVTLLSALVFAYGLASITGVIPWERASLRALGTGMALTVPVVGLGIYMSGASLSFVEPLLVCSLLYAAFFFPPRWAWPLSVELVAIAGLPLLYDPDAIDNAFLPRYVALAAAFLAVAWVMMSLKRRLVEAERHQRRIANRDHLTGIGNRRSFDAALVAALESRGAGAARERDTDGTPLALLILDLDGFKAVNDRFGHQAGDTVLRETAQRLRRVLRASDTVARIGGDEFAVIAPGSGGENARALAEAIQATVRIGVEVQEPAVPEPSIGWAVYPEDGVDADALMQVADRRMLHAKQRETGADGDEITIRARC